MWWVIMAGPQTSKVKDKDVENKKADLRHSYESSPHFTTY